MWARPERVRLVHELRELAAAEEVVDHGRERLRVDEALGLDLLVLGGGVGGGDRHALADDPLRAGEADAALVLEQFARGADAAVAEVVDVVDLAVAGVDADEQAQGADDVAVVEHAQIGGDGALAAALVDEVAELLVELVAADLAEIVAAVVEEEALDELLGVGGGDGVARAQLVVDVAEGLLLAGGGVGLHRVEQQPLVPFDVEHRQRLDPGEGDLLEDRALGGLVAVRELGVRGGVEDVGREAEVRELLLVLERGADLLVGVEVAQDVLVGGIPQAAQERRDEELAAAAAAVHEHPDLIVRVELDLDPRPAVGDDAHGVQRRAVGVYGLFRAYARRAVELADDDTLRAVDDEGPVLGHERNFAHVDVFGLLYRALLTLAVALGHAEAECHAQRSGMRPAFAQRLEGLELGLVELVLDEFQVVATVKAD